MKHLLKSAVLLVIGLLAAQPVLSSLNCAAGLAAACAPGCSMAMSSMAPDCPMSGMSATEGCPQNCCTQNSVNAVLPKAATDKSKVTIHVPVAALASVDAAAGPEKPAAESLDARIDTPPLYILNRVFRI
jgi:hypothetical protein